MSFMDELKNAEPTPPEATPRWTYDDNAPDMIVGKLVKSVTIQTTYGDMEIVEIQASLPCGAKHGEDGKTFKAEPGTVVGVAIKGASLERGWNFPQNGDKAAIGQTVGIRFAGEEYSKKHKTPYPIFVVRVDESTRPQAAATTADTASSDDPFSDDPLSDAALHGDLDDLPF